MTDEDWQSLNPRVRTTSVFDPFDDDARGLSFFRDELVLGDEEAFVSSTLTRVLVEPQVDPDWIDALDGFHADLGDVAESVADRLEELIEDAHDRGISDDRFTIMDRLVTTPEHRGHGYGLRLLDIAVERALRHSAFVVWVAGAYTEPEETKEKRSDSLVQLYGERTNARLLSGRVMILP